MGAAFGPVYDAERYGARLVASPRHADVLLVTGVVTRNMLEPLRRTVEATPRPRVVLAVGDCARTAACSPTGTGWSGAVDDVVPVDLAVPGCPPRARRIVAALRRVTGDDRRPGGTVAQLVFAGLAVAGRVPRPGAVPLPAGRWSGRRPRNRRCRDRRSSDVRFRRGPWTAGADRPAASGSRSIRCSWPPTSWAGSSCSWPDRGRDHSRLRDRLRLRARRVPLRMGRFRGLRPGHAAGARCRRRGLVPARVGADGSRLDHPGPCRPPPARLRGPCDPLVRRHDPPELPAAAGRVLGARVRRRRHLLRRTGRRRGDRRCGQRRLRAPAGRVRHQGGPGAAARLASAGAPGGPEPRLGGDERCDGEDGRVRGAAGPVPPAARRAELVGGAAAGARPWGPRSTGSCRHRWPATSRCCWPTRPPRTSA